MTANCSCYRSKVFTDALGKHVEHRFTCSYRPQTNGKVERFNRTLAAEWAYGHLYSSDEVRSATYPDWLNHHRPRTGIGCLVPVASVHKPTGNYN